MGYSGVIFAMMESAKEIEKQRKIDKLNTMKKEEVYVVIDSEEKRQRALKILSDAGEIICSFDSSLIYGHRYKYLRLDNSGRWFVFSFLYQYHRQITLDQLEQILSPKQEPMKLDALKLIAESYGFELVEKKREIKVGDFGRFWRDNEKMFTYGFLKSIDKVGTDKYEIDYGNWFVNFCHLTDEEKANIQENW
jgi:hypothetical protein